jgi:hypothetical protein
MIRNDGRMRSRFVASLKRRRGRMKIFARSARVGSPRLFT